MLQGAVPSWHHLPRFGLAVALPATAHAKTSSMLPHPPFLYFSTTLHHTFFSALTPNPLHPTPTLLRSRTNNNNETRNMLNDNIEVFLRRVGPRPTRYLEYVRPGHEQKFQSQDMQCYVAATSEERFQVHVRLHHGFRYFTATCLEIRLWLDAHDEPDVYLRRKVHIPANGLKYVDFVLMDFAVQVGDHWENGDLCFGEVQVGQ